jgi:hypothetical protein
VFNSFLIGEVEASNFNFNIFIYLDALHYVSCSVMKILMFHLHLVIQSVVFKAFFIYVTLLELDGEAPVLFSIRDARFIGLVQRWPPLFLPRPISSIWAITYFKALVANLS